MRILVTLLAALLLTLVPVTSAGPAAAGTGTWSEERPRGAWPLRPEPEVVERFDPPVSPYGAGHRGVDLLGSPGQSVRAALGGTVSYAGMLAGRGVVVVDHGATRTTYEPVTASVPVGTPVATGAPVGTLQVAGSHCFPRPCLHWGWIRNVDDVYLDPLLLVGRGPIRLLPLWRTDPASGTGGWRPPIALLAGAGRGWPGLAGAGRGWPGWPEWPGCGDRADRQARGCAC